MAKKFPAQKVLAHDRPWEERSYFSSIAPFRCSRRKACTLHESLPPQGGTSACHPDASSPLREILCHLDPEILRPSPELGQPAASSRGNVRPFSDGCPHWVRFVTRICPTIRFPTSRRVSACWPHAA